MTRPFGCCTQNPDNEDITAVEVSTAGEYIIRITTFHRSGSQWVLNTDASTMASRFIADWNRRPCYTSIGVTIRTQRYADEMSWMLQTASSYTESVNAACSGRNEICGSSEFPCNTANTPEACQALCSADDNCVSIEYNAEDSRCQLSSSCTDAVSRGYDGWSLWIRQAARTVLKGPKSSTIYLGARHDAPAQEDNPGQWTYFLGNIAGVYLFRSDLEADEAACLFRGGEAQIGVCKDPAEMRGSRFYGEMLDGTLPDGVTLNGAAYLDGAAGAKLGGADDSISIDMLDYSSRGQFTIAFWMTQTECRIPGSWEAIFSHSRDDNWWSGDNAYINMYALCTDEGGASTLGGSIIRVMMRDDKGQRGTFDWSLRSAKSGGFVTDSWLHFALAYSRNGITAYIDGQALEAISDRADGYGLQLRDLTGPTQRLRGDDQPANLAEAIDNCQNFCQAAGYSYFGLQWTSECYCDNSYGSFGQASANAEDNADGLPGCDVDMDGTPDCGFGKSGVEGRMRCRGDPEVCEQEMACSWRNAVYDIQGASPSYVGCFMDGRRPSTCAEATDCETCALMVDQGCGWNGGRRGTNTCEVGGYTSSWECSVSEYGFPRDPYRSNTKWWEWAETEENVLWPDPTAVRKESCRAYYGAPAEEVEACAAVALDEEQTKANCRAVNSNYVAVAEPKTWADAEAHCQSMGGNLASIHSDAAQANAVLACSDVSDSLRCWIGLSDRAEEGTFVWSDGTPLDFEHWADGEPNDWSPDPDDDNYDPANTTPGEDAVGLWHTRDVCQYCTQAQERAVESWNDFSEDREMPFVCEMVPSDAASETPSCVYGPEIELGGMTLDEVYAANTDYYYTDLMLDPGVHVLTARAAWAYGWHDGYWEVMYTDPATGENVTVAGGETAGQVTADIAFGFVNVPRDVGPMTLHIRTGWTGADLSWSFDEASEGSDGPVYAGPEKGTITLGGSRYEGAVAGVTMLSTAIDEDDADCLFRDGEGKIQICATADMLAQERATSYYGSFKEGEDLPRGTILNGDAYVDGDFGVQLDGEGDYVTIDASWSSAAYGLDGAFGIAMWFTKGSECLPSLGEDTFATLYSHKKDDGVASQVQIQVGCDQDAQHSTVAGGGDIIRIWLADADGKRVLFDVAMSAARSGDLVTDEWVHLMLSVSSTKVLVYLDGVLLNMAQPAGFRGSAYGWPGYAFGYPRGSCGGCESWVNTPENLAAFRQGFGYPPILTLEADVPDDYALGSFTMYESYRSNREYNFTMWMPPGEHSITTEDTGGPNQWHGGSWRLVETNRDLSGHRSLLSDEDVALGLGQTRCAQLCRDQGFQYMGLQWTAECFCDNDYGSRGQMLAEDCDGNGDGQPDCGTDAGELCSWRNAIFDLNTPRAQYLGCFLDSEDDDGGAVVAEGLGGDSVTFSVPYPPGIFGVGPTCGERYHDWDTFDTPVTLPAGVSYFHAGARGENGWAGNPMWSCNWLRPTRTENQYGCSDGTQCTGWRCCSEGDRRGNAQCPPNRPWMCADPNAWRNTTYACERTEADCDRYGGVRGCPTEEQTYWTLWSLNPDGSPAAVLAGGPEDGTCCSQPANLNEQITPIVMPAETQAVMRLTTLSLSGVRWYINDSPEPTCTLDSCWDSCSQWSDFNREYLFHVQTGAQRPWEIAWQLDNGRRFKGPVRSGITIGADSRRRGEFEGSVAEVMILRDPVEPEDADCIYNYGSTQIGGLPCAGPDLEPRFL